MDLAVQEYGNFEAFLTILEDNPNLSGLNDYPAGQMIDDFCDFDIAHPIKPGIEIKIREDSDLINQGIIRKLNGQEVISE